MAAKTHGKSRDSSGRNTKEYKAWRGMLDRCFNENNQYFHHYGGRGITVCARWILSFENFYAYMGDAPSKDHSLGRIDNDGNYEMGNVAWQTQKEQASNKRKFAHRWPVFEELLPKIKELSANGMSTRKIADLLGVSKSRVWVVLSK